VPDVVNANAPKTVVPQFAIGGGFRLPHGLQIREATPPPMMGQKREKET
jgi:hypothetical protein